MIDLAGTDTFIRLLYTAGGAAAGYYVGLTRNDARAARREVHDVEEHLHRVENESQMPAIKGPPGPPGAKGPQGEDKDTPFMRRAMFVVVVVVAVYATYFATVSDDKLDKAQSGITDAAESRAALAKQVRCINRINETNIDAQKARATFQEQQAQITLTLYDALLNPKTTGPQVRAALVTARIAVRDSLRVAADNPFPPIADVRECIK